MSSGGGNQTTTSRTEPYAPAEPFLQDILGEAQNIYRSGLGREFFPSSTVVPFAEQTQQALNLQQAQALEQAQNSALQAQAAQTFGQFAGSPMSSYTGRMGQGMGSSYGQLTPQADYLSGIREGITSDVLGSVQSQFGGMGRTGTSPQAQQAVARGITQAYAPIASQLASTERGREMQGLESQLGRQFSGSQADIGRQQAGMESAFGRQLQAAGQLPGIQQGLDLRRQQAIASLGGVGSAYENLAQRQLQDQIARFQFGQTAPMQQLQQYAGLISPIASGFPTGVSNAPSQQSGGLGGAFGGAVAGSALGAPGAIGGAVLGGLGFL
tara:strand:+ start:745 stop:1722 length:978 start_codon:yes stop_codon:yes gene_type:complete